MILSDENEILTICYYADWVVFRRGKGHYEPEDILYQHCTHIIYVFSVLDEETKDRMVPGEPTIDLEESKQYYDFFIVRTPKLRRKLL